MMKAVAGAMIVALVATGAVAAVRVHPTAETRKAVAAGLANPARADQATDDDRRKAEAVLVFSGIGPRDRVVDVLPGAGYWTRIFSGVVGPKGQVYAWWPQAAATRAEKSITALQDRKLANVVAEAQANNALTFAKPVDLVWTSQNYHDLANNGGGEAALTAFNTSVYKALNTGGTYIVIDHAAAAGSGITATDTLHRIDKEAVKAQVTSVGFKFVGETNVLANPADDHTLKVFDPTLRGHTDQFVLKFRK